MRWGAGGGVGVAGEISQGKKFAAKEPVESYCLLAEWEEGSALVLAGFKDNKCIFLPHPHRFVDGES